ncbi:MULTISPECIES: hypothetical protein [unclassified Thioalkalivibrio]|uniref:hypothetical protein n=1 Tax=unclassified Thioalkalivibrio TaxID=2621013 RepID=UPI0003750C94|nr:MULTISPECIES: hypothetical protein [unclassified Thioalkalivibrio]
MAASPSIFIYTIAPASGVLVQSIFPARSLRPAADQEGVSADSLDGLLGALTSPADSGDHAGISRAGGLAGASASCAAITPGESDPSRAVSVISGMRLEIEGGEGWRSHGGDAHVAIAVYHHRGFESVSVEVVILGSIEVSAEAVDDHGSSPPLLPRELYAIAGPVLEGRYRANPELEPPVDGSVRGFFEGVRAA